MLSIYVKVGDFAGIRAISMTSAARQIIRFGSFELDLARNELRDAGSAVEVEPQVFDLIAFLASRPGNVLSREEIIDAVWQGRIVSDSAVSTRINAARQALGDDGKSQRMIRTVSRRGFLFVPDIELVDHATAPIDGPSVDVGSGQEKPSIVVLPFENLSADSGQSFFSDGIADDIITDLSRYGELFVIAR